MEKNIPEILTTDDHESLNAFYAANDLEITEDAPVSTDTLKSWTVYEGEPSVLAAASTLAYRQNEYIIDGIAVDPAFRGREYGTALLDAVKAEVKSRGGSRIYLVARAPEFFRANGYETVKREDAPEFFECFGCEQYGVSCFPEVMKHEF